jgi:quercetin dioxygenase-like cupin family protein
MAYDGKLAERVRDALGERARLGEPKSSEGRPNGASGAPASVTDLHGNGVASRFEGKEHGATVSFFVTRFPPGCGPALHRHPYEETFLVEEGTATFAVDGRTVVAHAGQVVVVPAGAAHGFVNSAHGVLRQVSIHPSDQVVQEWVEG